VNEGVLAAGVASVANTSGAFGNNSAMVMGTALSAGLNITGFNTQVGSLSGGGYGAGGVILGAATLSVGGDNSSPAAYLGPISGTGSVTKIGSGTWTVSGNSSYTGVTKIDNGTLNLGFRIANGGIASSMGQSTNAATNLVIGGGTLKYSGTDAAKTDRLFTIGSAVGDTATLDASGTGAGTLAFTNTGSIAFGNTNAHTLTLTGTNTGNNSLAAIIGDNTGSTSLVKDGAGTWILSGANTYSGATSVNVGTLAVTGSLAADSTVTVSGSGTKLMGTGTVGGNTTINAGAILAPGIGVGKETFSNNLTLGAVTGSIFEWELAATPKETPSGVDGGGIRGTDYDAVNVAGSLSGAGAIFRVVLTGSQNFSEAFWTANRTWTDIFKTADGGSNVADWASAFSSVQTYNASGSIAPAVGSFSMTGNSLTWTYSAVPEVSNLLAGLLLGAGLLRRRR
jgi:fibronectin-binding autotransporter adhesin